MDTLKKIGILGYGKMGKEIFSLFHGYVSPIPSFSPIPKTAIVSYFCYTFGRVRVQRRVSRGQEQEDS